MQKRFALISVLVLALGSLIFCNLAFGQMNSSKPSPAASASCQFADGKSIQTAYSSPRMKGRKIYGGLVPYGEVWRTGANEATTLVTDTNLTVGGKDVPAGSYTIFTVPTADKWTLIINKTTGEWGIPYKYEANELARVDMNVTKMGASVENFTIAYDQNGGGCTLHMDWEMTRASVDISERK